jgi:F-type H+-transporting ATPase subunit delta
MKTAKQAERDAKRLWSLCLVNGSLDESRARLVVEQTIESGAVSGTDILRRFLRLLRLDVAARTARVESAVPLAADVRVAIEEGLTRRYGPAIATTFVVDPALIGGVRVRIGDDVFDGSVRAGLTALEARF